MKISAFRFVAYLAIAAVIFCFFKYKNDEKPATLILP